MLEKFKFKYFPTVTLCYDYLINNNDIDENEINKSIEFVCKHATASELFHFLNNAAKLNLSKYNISDLVHALAETDDIGYMLEVANTDIITKNDRFIITNTVYLKASLDDVEYYIYNAKQLDNADYSLLSERIVKSKDPEKIYKFTNEFLSKIKQYELSKLTFAICSTRSIKYIIEFSKLDIDDNISTIVDTLCAISALSDLVRFTKQVQLNDELYIHKITHEFTREDRINSKDIRSYINACANLTEIDFNELTNAMLKTKNISAIISYAKEICDISNVDHTNSLNKITNYICNNGSAKDIYTYASNVNLSSENVNKLAKELLKKDDIKYTYLFLENVSNIDKAIKKELIDKIIVSRQMKYICLIIAFVDITLLHKLFTSISDYLLCINSLGYTKEELSSIYHKLFDLIPNEKIVQGAKEKVEKLALTIE